jgi:hypothetical protein
MVKQISYKEYEKLEKTFSDKKINKTVWGWDMYMIIDTLDIFDPVVSKTLPMKNSMKTVEHVCSLFEKFCKENNIDCGNIYIVEFEESGKFFAVCDWIDGLNWAELEEKFGTDYSIEFNDWCESKKIELDASWMTED